MSGSRVLFKPLDVDRGKNHIKSLAVKGSREARMGGRKSRRSNGPEQQRWYRHSSTLHAVPGAGELLCSSRKPALTPLSPSPPRTGFGYTVSACCSREHRCRAARWVHPPGVHPGGVHPSGVYPGCPMGVHPNGLHPDGTYPAGVHPNGVHPAGVHPGGIYPAVCSPVANRWRCCTPGLQLPDPKSRLLSEIRARSLPGPCAPQEATREVP